MQTIAILNLGYIGDIINTSPVCSALKEKYPDSRLIFITIPAGKQTAKCMPGVEEVYIYDKKGEDNGFWGLVKKALYIKKLEKIDMTIILNESIRAAFFAKITGSKVNVGRNTEMRGFLLSHTLPHLQEEKDMQVHVSEHYMRILKPINLYKENYQLDFCYSKDDNHYIRQLLEQNGYSKGEFVGFCPCARHDDKDWTPEESVKFINYINQNTNKKVIIVGDKKTSLFVDNIRGLGCNDFLDLSAQTSIPQLGALIDMFKLFVSADTGPMHLAYALKVPTVAFYYHDVTVKWGPLDIERNRTIVSADKSLIKAKTIIKNVEELL